MDQAIAHKILHPETTYQQLSNQFGVAPTTIHDHLHGTHSPHSRHPSRKLSIEQEAALIDKINAYANRGTLLTPGHIRQLALALAKQPLGKNWTSTFLDRHRDVISSRFYRIQEAARLKADTPSNRQAFYELVRHLDHLIPCRFARESPC